MRTISHAHMSFRRPLALLAPLMLAVAAIANYSVEWNTIDGGGGLLTGGSFTVTGTIGQHDAGAALTAGAYTISGGFWAGASSPAACAGDTNGDGLVNGADLSVLLSQFGQNVPVGTGADFNGSGSVNGADLSVLLARFGLGC